MTSTLEHIEISDSEDEGIEILPNATKIKKTKGYVLDGFVAEDRESLGEEDSDGWEEETEDSGEGENSVDGSYVPWAIELWSQIR